MKGMGRFGIGSAFFDEMNHMERLARIVHRFKLGHRFLQVSSTSDFVVEEAAMPDAPSDLKWSLLVEKSLSEKRKDWTRDELVGSVEVARAKLNLSCFDMAIVRMKDLKDWNLLNESVVKSIDVKHVAAFGVALDYVPSVDELVHVGLNHENCKAIQFPYHVLEWKDSDEERIQRLNEYGMFTILEKPLEILNDNHKPMRLVDYANVDPNVAAKDVQNAFDFAVNVEHKFVEKFSNEPEAPSSDKIQWAQRLAGQMNQFHNYVEWVYIRDYIVQPEVAKTLEQLHRSEITIDFAAAYGIAMQRLLNAITTVMMFGAKTEAEEINKRLTTKDNSQHPLPIKVLQRAQQTSAKLILQDASSCQLEQSNKKVPTCTLSLEEQRNLDGTVLCISDSVNIRPMKQRILSLDEQMWSEEYNAKHNVQLERPFHDKLGVNKIICIFSDTKLENVYHLPAWHMWKNLVLDVLRSVDIELDKVVRLLFARLPSNTEIPVHHDNGPWVSKTHRIHIPIVTNENVIFQSGLVNDQMVDHFFQENCAYELNNAAKHAVMNHSSECRVHLILDYVENELKLPIALMAGQKCYQIRGRVLVSDEFIDAKQNQEMAVKKFKNMMHLLADDSVNSRHILEKACKELFIEQIGASQFSKLFLQVFSSSLYYVEAKKICLDMLAIWDPELADQVNAELLPRKNQNSIFKFIIIGAQKSGTTSLYSYLVQHKNVHRACNREPHFFDWHWNKANTMTLPISVDEPLSRVLAAYNTTETQLPFIKKYICAMGIKSLDQLCPPMVLGESTPSYLLYGETVARRVHEVCPDIKLIVILRDPIERAYSHYCMTSDPNGTEKQLEKRRIVAGKSFEELIDEDLKALQHINPKSDASMFQQYADALPFHHGCHGYIGRGLYAFQLELWYRVFLRHQILVLNLNDMRDEIGTKATIRRSFEFLDLPLQDVDNTSRKNTRTKTPISDELHTRLSAFYAPYNQRLKTLLGHGWHNW